MIQLPAVSPGVATVREILDMLLLEYRLRARSTAPHLECRMRLHLLPLLGNCQAAALDHRYFQAYIGERQREEASNATINRELQHLRAALRLAVDGGLLTKAPRIRLLTEDNIRTGFLEHWQYCALRAALEPHMERLFVVAYHTGCRSGELLQLTWDQVDLGAGQIWLWPGQTKGKTPRMVPVYGDMEAALSASRRECDRYPDCRHVFHRGGQRIADYRKAWRRGLRKANLPGLRFHDLRRSAVRNMDRAGVPRATIRRIIGHETESMFQRYRIVDQREIAEAGQRIEAYLRSQPGAFRS